MKHDLSNICYMIHVRVDIPERLRNLEIVMEYYHQTCTDVQFVIVNDDKQPDQRLRRLYEKYTVSYTHLTLPPTPYV